MATLRERREALGISQERVAARLDISPRTLGRWERGHDPGEINRLRLHNLYKAAAENPEEYAA